MCKSRTKWSERGISQLRFTECLKQQHVMVINGDRFGDSNTSHPDSFGFTLDQQTVRGIANFRSGSTKTGQVTIFRVNSTLNSVVFGKKLGQVDTKKCNMTHFGVVFKFWHFFQQPKIL